MSKRKFKEEMLQAIAPEIYGPPDVKVERDIKRVRKREKKEEKKEEEALERALADDAVEFVRATAPRRRVQWKGRRVKRVLRPGTAVVFTPGERSALRALKREYDEVYADEDILEQAEQQLGEFAYGKRARYGDVALALDETNPTPSLKPVTLQQVLPVVESKKAIKREAEALQPTMQLMVPKKQRLEEVLEQMKVDPSVQPEVKIRPIKQVAPGLGVQTVDIQIPVRSAAVETMETQTEPPVITPSAAALPLAAAAAAAATAEMGVQTDPLYEYGAARRVAPRRRSRSSLMLPDYVLHPSITPTPGYPGRTYRPGARRTRRTASARPRRRRRRTAVLAPIRVRHVRRSGRTLVLPTARYHPSIV
ncbi:V [Simian adenovirus 16]|uniref:Core-capsid bridging protein n=1 Tax=Simian adenovirus 16 TaxID=1715778 RepID=A0A0M4MQK7_9ADEN|nr:V [Simian adenovirus 16] [Simian adenovirus 16]ALE30394.1 V [Simian adenovirus 16] [Simian adenovirus 16]